ncbi:MAG TPA: tail fiber domain-containing protein [Thermoanaerobaculia bacterium]|jgi:hypothetical protein|nr:tail fiber domain-containing protein [Thermoanaerobaculia bacterium]
MRHRRELLRWFTLVSIITCPLPLWGVDRDMQEPKTPIARLEVQPARVDWLPHVDYQGLILTVAGPGDLYVRQEFEAGQAPYLSLFDSKGTRLPEGSYAYELRIEPRLDQDPREGEEVPKRALVQSGYLAIQGGSFLSTDSTQQTPTGQGQLTPRPPLRDVTAKDIVQNDNLIVHGNACIGFNCNSGDATVSLVLKDSIIRVLFDDVPEGLTYTGDWMFEFNGIQGADISRFSVRDYTNNLVPFTIAAGAPNHSLYVRSNGNLGLGTSTPSAPLHVIRSNGTAQALVEEASGITALRNLFTMKNNGGIQVLWDRTDGSSKDWQMSNFSATFEISIPGSSPGQFSLNQNGNLTIGGTQYLTGSSRSLKENFIPVDGRTILQRLADMPLTSWNAKDDPVQRHIGPVAEDWWATFGLGPDDKHVSTTDVGGVALAAIKGLHQVVAEKETEIASLKRDNTGLTQRMEALEALVARLMKERESPAQAQPAPAEQN